MSKILNNKKKKLFFYAQLLIFTTLFFANNLYSQHFLQIESILVDACSTVEGENEMVGFRVEDVAINVADIRVDGASNGGAFQTNKWPSNSFLGWILPSTTAWNNAVTKVAQINASIVNCGKLIMPTGGTNNQGLIPAGKKGIIITSTDFSPFANDFSTLSDTLYVIFQKPGNTNGHFANYSSSSGLRSIRLHQISTGTNEDATYDKVLLVNQSGTHTAQDGAGVRFSENGTATYYNDGCQAPYIPLSAEWAGTSICQSAAALNLNSLLVATSTTGGIWSGTGVAGNNFNPAGLSGNINITYSVGIAPCAISETHAINVIASANASWTSPGSICQSAGILDLSSLLSATSTTGGTWSGTGVSGTSFNPSGLNGNISIKYLVGTAPCLDSATHSITVISSANASWTVPTSICQSASALNLNTLLSATSTTGGTWSGTGVSGTTFNPAGLSGNISIKYLVGTVPCQDSVIHSITVISSANASWTSPGSICQSAGILDLSSLLSATSTTGGTWSGTGVSGTTFNPAGLTGNISIKYLVGTSPCQDSATHSITVISSANASWTAPGSICQSAGILDLSSLLSATSNNGGTWSGTGVSGTTFNPAGLSGNISIKYLVGTAPCQDSVIHTINVIPSANASWTAPTSICQSAGILDLSSLLSATSTTGGTWSGTGVTGTTFNPSGLSGNISIKYLVGTVPCQDSVIHSITVISSANASWTSPGSICQSAGILDLSSLLSATSTTGGTWSGTGVSGTSFNPAGLTGNISIKYLVGTSPCQDSVIHSITVISSANASWTSPGSICQSAGILDLSSLLSATSTTGGTWSGTGVSGTSFNPAGLTGNISIKYLVGTSPCQDSAIHTINVISSANASWTAPTSICQSASALNLTTLLTATSTTGGTWSGTGVSGTTFNPVGLSGNISIKYLVGTSPCQDSVIHTINVISSANASWTAPTSICQSAGTLNLNTLLSATSTAGGTWSGTGVTGTTFNPSGLNGNISIKYLVGTVPCQDSVIHSITVISSANASWTSPGSICQSAGILNLNTLLSATSTAGGTWSGTGVTGTTFNPSGLNGNISIKYLVGTAPCQDSATHSITVISSANASWTSPGSICQSAGILNLNTLLSATSTAGGTWSGTGVSGTTFNPSGLNGNISIKYLVGTVPCQDSVIHSITVISSANASWTSPGSICQSAGALDLSSLLSATSNNGGTWSGTGVSGTTFNPAGLTGNISIKYLVGTAPCLDSAIHTINVISSANASWTSPGSICQSAGILDLSSLLSATSTTGGTWSGTGVTGTTFNPSGLNGNISIKYLVGTAPCQDSVIHSITVISSANASWTSPGSICQSAGILNLNTLLSATSTAGGTWSGSGVSGTSFNPAGLSSNISIKYLVGTAPCQDSATHSITVISSANASWTSPGSICQSAGILDLSSLLSATSTTGGTWSGTGVTGTTFNPSGLSGNISIKYLVGTVPCQDSVIHSITVISSANASWTSPGSICQSAGILDLSSLLSATSTTGGTWSGSGVSGTSFNPAGLSGNISIKYLVGTAPCQDSATHSITVVPSANASWTSPGSICQSAGTLNLNTLLSATSTTGGTWSGTGVSGTSFNPAGLSGNISIKYLVGTAPCQDSATHSITVVPSANASWTSPGSICQSAGILNLNTLLSATSTAGGTWSGTGVSGTTFNPAGLSGNISIKYLVGTTPCLDSTIHTINVIPSANAAWTALTSICQSAGTLDLSTLLSATSTTGGTWSGTGVSGTTFNPSGLNGNISIKYLVGTSPCQDSVIHTINVISSANASWTAPTSICQSASALNLTTLLTATSTTGGTWSGTGVTGTTFNPSGLSGNISIKYLVGTAPCQDSVIHTINVIPSANASWTAPTSICQSAGILDLSSLLSATSTTGGTWSGTGVTGTTFNPSGLSGNISIKYLVGTVPCQDSVIHSITVISSANASWTSPGSICQSAGILDLSSLLSATSTTGGTWSGSGVSGTSFNPAGLSGNISIKYLVGTAPCQDSATHSITVVPSANASWTSPGSICQSAGTLNLNTLLSATSTTGGTWSGTGVSGTTFNPAGLSGNISIKYLVGTSPCQDSATHSITVISSANASWTSPGSICQSAGTLNLNTLLSATSTTGGTWSGTGVTGTTFNPSGLNGNISIKYLVGTSPCQDSVIHTINVISSANASWTAPTSICQSAGTLNLNTLLSATSTAGGTWSGTGVTGTTFNPSGLNGNISIKYLVGTSPCQDSATHSITVVPSANASWTSPGSICQSAGILNLNTLLSATSTAGGTWSGTGVTGTTFNPSGLNGNISIKYLVGTTPCLDSATHSITVISSANASWTSPGSICQSDATLNLATLLDATATLGGIWSGSGVTGTSFSPAGLSGNITLTYTVGTAPCSAFEDHIIQVLASSNAAWTAPSSICADATPIDLSLLVTGDNGGTWSGNGVSGSIFNPAGLSGDVAISYFVNPTHGCPETVTHTINVTPAPVASWNAPAVICKTQSTFDLNTLITGTQGGTWSGNGVTSNLLDLTTVGSNLEVTYTITNNGCVSSSTAMLHFSSVDANFTISPASGVAPLNASTTNLSQNAISYFWNFGNGVTSTEETPSTQFLYEGTFYVWLTATSALGCKDSTYQIVTVDESPDFIPNVFTPNEDMVNDEFYPIISKITENYQMMIFNRWGELIFETTRQKDRWDGTYHNAEVPVGVYFYTIMYSYHSKLFKYNGSITLLR